MTLSENKLIGTLMIFVKVFFKKKEENDFETANTKISKNYRVCKELKDLEILALKASGKYK